MVPVASKRYDWKAISSLITLHVYLELNSHALSDLIDGEESSEEKRLRTQKHILNAMNARRDTGGAGRLRIEGGRWIGVREIGYLSISEALDHREKSEAQNPNAEEEPQDPGQAPNDQQRRFRQLYDPPQVDVHPFPQDRGFTEAGVDWPRATYAACLGRFDRIILSDSSPLLTHRLPRFPRLDDDFAEDDGDGTSASIHHHWDIPYFGNNDDLANHPDLETFAAFVQKREVALELKLDGATSSAEQLVPLALVGIGLAQRYSRLEFVARLLKAIAEKPRIGAYALEGAYRLIEQGDQVFLTDGAYDLTLVLMGSKESGHDANFRRLMDVLRFSITLHGDFMVDRTETHLLVPMIDSVLTNSNQRLSISQEVRLKESSTQQYAYRFLHEKFNESVEKENAKIIEASKKDPDFPDELKPVRQKDLDAIQPTMRIVPGRADVTIDYDSRWLKLHWHQSSPNQRASPSYVLDGMMSIVLKDWYVDRVATTIGVDPEALLAWKSTTDPKTR